MSRVLIAGISSSLGGRIAQELERDRRVEAIVGVDTDDPRHELERTEFVRVDIQAPLIRRILAGAAIDTVIDVRLTTDPLAAFKRAHEVNVIATGALLEACAQAGAGVRRLIFKSSAQVYGSEADDPAFFTEDMERQHQARTAIERDVVSAEQAVAAFSARNPRTAVTVLRVATEIGSSRLPLLGLPFVPSMLGFDPRCQFIHDDDVVGALTHVTRHGLHGVYNAAADGVLALSEIASLLGKPLLPVVPPWGASFAASQLRRLGVPIPLESISELRYGRGIDNRRLKAAGYNYRYTTREAVMKLRAQQRLRPLLRSGGDSYRYEREVEEFLRWSPSVQAVREKPGASSEDDGRLEPQQSGSAGNGAPPGGYDELTASEVIGLIDSLDHEAASRLRRYEAANRARKSVLQALDRRLAQVRQPEE